MHSVVTCKNEGWCLLIWLTLYILPMSQPMTWLAVITFVVVLNSSCDDVDWKWKWNCVCGRFSDEQMSSLRGGGAKAQLDRELSMPVDAAAAAAAADRDSVAVTSSRSAAVSRLRHLSRTFSLLSSASSLSSSSPSLDVRHISLVSGHDALEDAASATHLLRYPHHYFYYILHES